MLALVVCGPAVEEVMKLAATTYVVAVWPYRFRTGVQSIVVAVAIAFRFVVIENLFHGLYNTAMVMAEMANNPF